jgi:hypothetical protein
MAQSIKRNVFEIKAQIRRDSHLLKSAEPLPSRHKGAIVGTLTWFCNGERERRVLLGWLFDQPNDISPFVEKSTKQLDDGQWRALNNWLDSRKDDETGQYILSERFLAEIGMTTRFAIIQLYGTKKAAEMNAADEWLSQQLVSYGGVDRKDKVDG